MKVRYIHASNKKLIKIHDTKKAYANMGFAICDPSSKLYNKTQEEFDELYKKIFEEDKRKGVILEYEILEEGDEA